MLLTIHNLPYTIRYTDIKALLLSKCGINEVILDNLVDDGDAKKVTVGLADEGDAAILVRKINGLYLAGQQLYVEDVRQKKASEQPYRSKDFLGVMKNTQVDPRDNISQHDYQPDAWNKYHNTERIQQRNVLPSDSFRQPDDTQQRNAFQKSNYQSVQPYVDPKQMLTVDPMAVMMNYNMAPMYYVPAVASQNSYLDYDGQAQQVASAIPQYDARVQQESSFGFGVEKSRASIQENRPRDWGHDNSRLYGDRERQSSPKRVHVPAEQFPSRQESRWDTPKVAPREARPRNRSPQRAQFNSREPFFVQNNNFNAIDEHRDAIPGTRKKSPGRSETFNSDAFGDPMRSRREVINHLPSSSTHARHFAEQPVRAPPPQVWDSRRDGKSRWDHPSSSQNRDDGNRQGRDDPPNAYQPRGDLRSPQDDFQFRNSYRNAKRPVGKQQNTHATRGPPTKRFPDRRNERDEPQPKRFAPMSRKDFPNPRKPGPQNFQNFNPKPVKAWKGSSSALPRNPGPSKVNPSASQPRSGPYKALPPHHQKTLDQQEPSKAKLVALLRRDQTWRSQATAQIAKDILQNLEITDMGKNDEIVTRMKSTIRSRIEVMMTDQLSVPLMEIIKRYRSKYQPDSDSLFFMTILDEIKSDANKEGDDTNIKESGVATERSSTKPNIKASGEPKGKANPVKVPDIKPVSAAEKLPKYINADKKAYKQMIQIQRLEATEDHLYELPSGLQKALDDECDVLCDLFMAECEVPDTAQEKTICERISDQVADDFRKLVRLNVTKRLLDVNTNLVVRLYCHGKPPSRDAIEAFLKKYGVASLKKSDRSKMFVAHCDSHRNYDALCALDSVNIDGVAIQIKPLHVTGAPAKVSRAQVLKQRRDMIEAQIDHSGETLLEAPGDDNNDLETPGPELQGEEEYADEDEIDQDLEEVVKECADLDNDYVPENADLKDGADVVKEEVFEVDEDDLEDY